MILLFHKYKGEFKKVKSEVRWKNYSIEDFFNW
jgi:hypothetical protein